MLPYGLRLFLPIFIVYVHLRSDGWNPLPEHTRHTPSVCRSTWRIPRVSGFTRTTPLQSRCRLGSVLPPFISQSGLCAVSCAVGVNRTSHHERKLALSYPVPSITSIVRAGNGVAAGRCGPRQAQLRDLLPPREQVPLRRRRRRRRLLAAGDAGEGGPRSRRRSEGAGARDRRLRAGTGRRAASRRGAGAAGGGAQGQGRRPRRPRRRLLRRRGGRGRRGRPRGDAVPEGGRREAAVHGIGRAGVRRGEPRQGRLERRRGLAEVDGGAVPAGGEVVLAPAGVRRRHAQGHRRAAARPVLRPRVGRAVPLLPRRRRRERQLRLPPARRLRRHLRRRERAQRGPIGRRAHGHRRGLRGRGRHGQPRRRRDHARAPQQAGVPPRRRSRRPPRRLHRLRLLLRRRRLRYSVRWLANPDSPALAVARRDGPPHRRGRRRHGRPSSGHGVRAHVRPELRSHPGCRAGALDQGDELAGREEGDRDRRRHADAAERGGGALPRPAAIGEHQQGEDRLVRGGAGEGARPAEQLPRAAQRGHQAGGHAAAVVGDHRLLGHRHGQDSLDHAVAGVAGLPALARLAMIVMVSVLSFVHAVNQNRGNGFPLHSSSSSLGESLTCGARCKPCGIKLRIYVAHLPRSVEFLANLGRSSLNP